jgi:hypothetical protein
VSLRIESIVAVPEADGMLVGITRLEDEQFLTPQQIADVLIQLDPDDLDDVFKLLRDHYDKLIGVEEALIDIE